MYGSFHPTGNVYRFLMSVERRIREDENSLGFCVANWEENLIRGTDVADTINTEDNVTTG